MEKDILKLFIHDVKNEITSFILFVQTNVKKIHNELNHEVPAMSELQDAIDKKTEFLRNYLNSLLLEDESGQASPDNFLKTIYKEFEETYNIKIIIGVKEKHFGTYRKDYLRAIFHNIIKNSSEAGAKILMISLYAQKIIICDDGQNIDEKAFNSLIRVESSHNDKTRGHGLKSIKHFAQEIGLICSIKRSPTFKGVEVILYRDPDFDANK